MAQRLKTFRDTLRCRLLGQIFGRIQLLPFVACIAHLGRDRIGVQAGAEQSFHIIDKLAPAFFVCPMLPLREFGESSFVLQQGLRDGCGHITQTLALLGYSRTQAPCVAGIAGIERAGVTVDLFFERAEQGLMLIAFALRFIARLRYGGVEIRAREQGVGLHLGADDRLGWRLCYRRNFARGTGFGRFGRRELFNHDKSIRRAIRALRE